MIPKRKEGLFACLQCVAPCVVAWLGYDQYKRKEDLLACSVLVHVLLLLGLLGYGQSKRKEALLVTGTNT